MDPTRQDIEAPPAVSYEEPQVRRQAAAGVTSHNSENATPFTRRNTSNFKRQKSLVRPERERIDRNHPQYHYRNATQNLDGSHIRVKASTTGNDPTVASSGQARGVRRGKSVLGREPEKAGQPRIKAKSTEPTGKLDGLLKKKSFEWPSKWVLYYNALTCCFPAALLKSCGKAEGLDMSCLIHFLRVPRMLTRKRSCSKLWQACIHPRSKGHGVRRLHWYR